MVHLYGQCFRSKRCQFALCCVDEVDSEPHGGFVLSVEPDRSLRREAKHLNKPRVWWRGGRTFGPVQSWGRLEPVPWRDFALQSKEVASFGARDTRMCTSPSFSLSELRYARFSIFLLMDWACVGLRKEPLILLPGSRYRGVL